MPEDKRAWFAPKHRGFGTGHPITWEGWLVTLLFVGGNLASALLLGPRHPLATIAILVLSSIIVLLILPGRTRGGWRHHQGNHR
jgi:hypothetical protein